MKKSKTSQKILHQGFLIKSPSANCWPSKWKKRWFVLGYSDESLGQYVIKYYVEKDCKKLKGIINLENCKQVNADLNYDERQKYKYMFCVKTPERVYYLLAKTEIEMTKWVHVICQACRLAIYTEGSSITNSSPVIKLEIKSTPSQLPSIKLDESFNTHSSDKKEKKTVQKYKSNEKYYYDINQIAMFDDKSSNDSTDDSSTLKYAQVVFHKYHSSVTSRSSSPSQLKSDTTPYIQIDKLKTLALEKAKQHAEIERISHKRKK